MVAAKLRDAAGRAAARQKSAEVENFCIYSYIVHGGFMSIS